jgi:hypothetical protein
MGAVLVDMFAIASLLSCFLTELFLLFLTLVVGFFTVALSDRMVAAGGE